VTEEGARVVRSLLNGERRDFAGLPCSPTLETIEWEEQSIGSACSSRMMSSGWVSKPFKTDESPDPSLAVDVSGQGIR
jgi:hypothetical protein